ncbi:bifunctional diaminohydroxyphosphoribosylaminopyrimidine deaminase/5-amino-6-(5-phosphoribosylamino)uracil reductase RibD [Microbacterium protaetiae]|uniref:Riboflavin biosynthesis protein RibD n=1 Tax=Microbacterium protaetiae TaxID=2509458 RepID=A0A4P6E9N4_9MICO|nr:bifunctional diaminohydroxyphosphoribosylaminopyrimidine deaminase/5-amino-6-(5-phosphoribosylamino)uracil reductase RibD [Microbacterium protaetiae]QAY58840.1 bifunctional diaminohydroxyphosphoribosylaminopyrimidine deaminase/5-amino-6-(5-phosphoribosylamino)uracil reductase RibD [Microbacterium protaetiae]
MSVSRAERDAMRRAFELARRGPRGVNPQVGAVVLSPAGSVIAEGWHRGAGTAHAEVDALSHLPADAARGATIVVTLEPCNHTGRTGPCALALIEAGVARVVFSAEDPGVHSGGGAARLRAAGVDVAAGLLAEEGVALIDDWLVSVRLGRPFITVKWAQSLDGRAAASDGSSQWITGPAARADVHERRAATDAILVGTGTVLADDPALTARRGDGTLYEHQPLPVVLGTREVPRDAAIRRHPHEPIFFDRLDTAVRELRDRGIQRLFIEGGPTVASAVVRAGLADEVLAYIAPVLLGGDRLALTDIGVPTLADAPRLRVVTVEKLGDDLLVIAQPVTAAGRFDAAPDSTTETEPAAPDSTTEKET